MKKIWDNSMCIREIINDPTFPFEPFEARRVIINKTGEMALVQSVKYIKEQYNKYEVLECAIDFIVDDLVHTDHYDGRSLQKLGFFSLAEASRELENALNLIMLSLYKNSYDSMRRTIELIVIGTVFGLEGNNQDSQEWLKSKKNTPSLKKTIEKLVKYGHYASCESQYQLCDFIKGIFHKLSDFIHVKGIEKSHRVISPLTIRSNDYGALKFNETSCKLSLELFIETIQVISLVRALDVPVLLVGFDLDAKFGLDDPISGLFTYDQADRIYKLIPEQFKSFVDELIENDAEICAVKKDIDSVPDITEEEFNQQCKEFENTCGNILDNSCE